MTVQPPEYPPYATANSLENQYQSTVTPAVKILAAYYLARSVSNSGQDSPSESEAKSALVVLIGWLDNVYDLAKALFAMPHFTHVADDNLSTFSDTIDRLKSDLTKFHDTSTTDSNPATVASQLLLRMRWSLDWVRQHMQSPPPSAATKKIWVSRLDAKTCSIACRKMHGTSVGINDTFTARAIDQGVPPKMLYGSLWGPPIHPNCRCHLIYL